MEVTLKPLSHPELGEIVITDELFPIGRGEPPFVSYESEAIAHLSRRHARIFREEEGIYVADLGSRNGTQLNDKPVEFKPVKLLSGDKLSFASHLDYEVDIAPSTEQIRQVEAPTLWLTLVPTREDSALEPITVTRFPFLIGKSEPAFAAGGEAQNLGYLSRRHAHFFTRGDTLHVEDLGSTNGTVLNGHTLDEHSRPVTDGDVIVFGGEYFSYRLQLQSAQTEQSLTGAAASAEAEEEAPAEVASAPQEGNTILVATPNSFIDIFYDPEEDEAEPTPEQPDVVEPEADDPGGGPVGRPGIMHRIKTFSRELSSAFGDGRSRNPYSRWIGLGVVLLLMAVGLGIYFDGKTQRDIEALLAQERFDEAADLAGEYLADHPRDETARAWATEALARYAVARWLGLVEQRDFRSAQALIADVRPRAEDNETATAMLDLLEWITSVQRFIDQRGGADAPIRIYEHEQQIESILQWWDRDPKEYRSRMREIENYVPEFKATATLAFSQLRSLRNEKSVYLTAIDKLKRRIERTLEADQPAQLAAEIEAFSRQYPRVGGLNLVRDDLQHYLAVHSALQKGDRLRAAVLIENNAFNTPPFAQRVERLQETLLPSAKVTQRYRAASDAWREGDLTGALDLLDELSQEQGGELALRDLAAKQKIMTDYVALQQYRGTQEFGERLVSFYSGLDPQEDLHFTRALDNEFKRHSAAARERADAAWRIAQTNWRDYREGGGIRGLLRLEEQVSPQFQQQAALLRDAQAKAGYARQVYDMLGLEYSAERAELHRQIGAEMTLQRRSLQQLSMVLAPGVLDEKLRSLDTTQTGE